MRPPHVIKEEIGRVLPASAIDTTPACRKAGTEGSKRDFELNHKNAALPLQAKLPQSQLPSARQSSMIRV